MNLSVLERAFEKPSFPVFRLNGSAPDLISPLSHLLCPKLGNLIQNQSNFVKMNVYRTQKRAICRKISSK
uniref:Uncharacterized protein n=1 Tax=Nelumbo nucifera TaxID=4432 RepID=A0A822YH49_NELNU|nr:TPA_asm: hypothetical protein HUJ06_009166 [Nelumbo nucifera]